MLKQCKQICYKFNCISTKDFIELICSKAILLTNYPKHYNSESSVLSLLLVLTDCAGNFANNET
ncbi:hypothetical protein BpHYR1_020808 [Brachionus plicatilis]|uniref:Uncharacterized protein n=1 Tax=Brachionus plicatilis TaxID=10195 RepID=A0A3M7PUV1_BRAPC|nr:hypothetical protein BpHYR1_020808 [Brachionus plicatilis]